MYCEPHSRTTPAHRYTFKSVECDERAAQASVDSPIMLMKGAKTSNEGLTTSQ